MKIPLQSITSRSTPNEDKYAEMALSVEQEADRYQNYASPAMECEAAADLFKRSKEELHLRYTQVISDGDSKTITHLNNMVKPYGGEVTIVKHNV